MRLALPSLAFVAGFAVAGCTSHTDTPPTTDAADSATVTCQNDPRALAYTANMEQPGASKTFTFVLVEGDPAPPARGNNTWTLAVKDAAGAPLDGATVDVKPFMPDHGHGTSVAATVAPGASPGTYTITPLYLFMPGLWQVTFTATKGSATDSAVFSFCVEG
jgi:hypothetical protein